MSEGSIKPVRQRMPPLRTGTHRRLAERLALRFPRGLDLLVKWVQRLPPRSRIRQAVFRRAVRWGFEASNREDQEATFMLYHPDCESLFPTQMATIGEPGTRGREERISWEQRWRTEWGDFRYAPEEFIDLGDQYLIVGRLEGSGVGSGAFVGTDWAVLLTSAGGLAIREQVFFDRHEALEAAGLREES
jgi:ketosteroid isomerase-like protein